MSVSGLNLQCGERAKSRGIDGNFGKIEILFYNITFGKFKNDIDRIIDDTKNINIDIEELEADFKHCDTYVIF